MSIGSAYMYEGPYRWLAELQLALFGRYFVKLTFAFTLLACGLVVSAVALLARHLGLLSPPSAEEVASDLATTERLNARMKHMQGPLMLVALGGVFAFVGVRDLWSAARGGELRKIDAAQLEQGKDPGGTWLELNGLLLSEGAVKADNVVYVPLVSKTWKVGTPLGALLKLPANANPGVAPFRGARDPEDVPGVVRVAYEKVGVDAGAAVVLKLGKSPAQEKNKATWFAGVGLLVACVGAVVLSRQLRT